MIVRPDWGLMLPVTRSDSCVLDCLDGRLPPWRVVRWCWRHGATREEREALKGRVLKLIKNHTLDSSRDRLLNWVELY